MSLGLRSRCLEYSPMYPAITAIQRPAHEEKSLMAYDTSIQCPTPKCIDAVKRYGDRYLMVSARPGRTICELCGGILVDGEWIHRCSKCKEDVEPGQLCGLFTPHKCPGCEEATAEAEIRRGDVCRMCNQPYSRCCC